MIPLEFTHRGWLLLCPIYIGQLDTDGPLIDQRRFVPQWWFDANIALVGGMNWLLEQLDADYEPAFPIWSTGAIRR